jgi:hypothetical protein
MDQHHLVAKEFEFNFDLASTYLAVVNFICFEINSSFVVDLHTAYWVFATMEGVRINLAIST